MLRFLVAVDGSESSDRAVGHLLKKLAWYKAPAEIHLLNVQPALPGSVGRFVPAEQLQAYHRERGGECLASARATLDAAGVAYQAHISVGEPAQVIAQFAEERAVDQIVMGARGLGAVAGLVMGSVTAKVLGLTHVPVLLIR